MIKFITKMLMRLKQKIAEAITQELGEKLAAEPCKAFCVIDISTNRISVDILRNNVV